MKSKWIHALPKTGLLVKLLVATTGMYAQQELRGTVYDQTGFQPIKGVQVKTTGGHFVVTDSMGRYRLPVDDNDSVSFLYDGRRSSLFCVALIDINKPFDIKLPITFTVLPSVYVHPRIYRLDSLENRRNYEKIFNQQPGGIETPAGGAGLGLTSELLLSGRKLKQAEALQQRLKADEEYDYVSHRFTKALVTRITKLVPPALDTFMRYNRPGYQQLQSFESDYEYYQSIQTSASYFKDWWRKSYPEIPAESKQ